MSVWAEEYRSEMNLRLKKKLHSVYVNWLVYFMHWASSHYSVAVKLRMFYGAIGI